MIDYTLFNQYKAAGWKCNNREEFEKWQAEFKEYWNELEFVSQEQKDSLLNQIKELTEKKNAFFNKQGQRPVVNHYIFRQEEGEAFSNLCNALAEYLKNKTTTQNG